MKERVENGAIPAPRTCCETLETTSTEVDGNNKPDGDGNIHVEGWFGCGACKGGLYASLGVVLAACFVTGVGELSAAAAGAIAAATGLSEATVTAIFSGGALTSVGEAVNALCTAMHACP